MRFGPRPIVPALLVVVALAAGSCDDGSGRPEDAGRAATTSAVGSSSSSSSPSSPSSPRDQVLFAVGDIASCASPGDELTAALLDAEAAPIATLGDTVYERGLADEFANCFEPSWGRHKPRIRPAPGNHDYGTGAARGYFDYFGSAAGTRGEGWYSYDIGQWHLVAINSVCAPAGGCEAGSPQERWLRDDLARSRAACTIAYWHHPRFSSGLHGSDTSMGDIWRALYEAGADLVLSGHDHHYERFAPLDPAGRVDAERGIRQFVAGTGGNRIYPVGRPLPGSEIHSTSGYGVLRLELGDGMYRWRFIGVEGVTFTDAGEGRCH